MIKQISTLLLAVLLAGCSAKPTLPPRQALAAAEVKKMEADFIRTTRSETGVRKGKDFPAALMVFSPEAVVDDRTYGDHKTGSNAGKDMVEIVNVYFPNWQTMVNEVYIGIGEGLTVSGMWNMHLGYEFTESDPLIEADWFQVKENAIVRWRLFYALDSLKKSGDITKDELEKERQLLDAYQKAWSSGNAQSTAGLYTQDAIREDGLFNERFEGKASIQAAAKAFLAQYAGTRWELGLGFGEGRTSPPTLGGTFHLQVKDAAGKDCVVNVAVILETKEYKITHERLFYDATSLMQCGWAK